MVLFYQAYFKNKYRFGIWHLAHVRFVPVSVGKPQPPLRTHLTGLNVPPIENAAD